MTRVFPPPFLCHYEQVVPPLGVGRDRLRDLRPATPCANRTARARAPLSWPTAGRFCFYRAASAASPGRGPARRHFRHRRRRRGGWICRRSRGTRSFSGARASGRPRWGRRQRRRRRGNLNSPTTRTNCCGSAFCPFAGKKNGECGWAAKDARSTITGAFAPGIFAAARCYTRAWCWARGARGEER